MPCPSLSVVVPLYNEEPNVAELIRAVAAALGAGEDWELILVNDGSADGTAGAITAAAAQDSRVRALTLASHQGQTAALASGFDAASGVVVITMDGDLQNDPRDIPRLLARLNDGFDLVVGYRQRRHDSWLGHRAPSWLANRIIRAITGVPIRDVGCTLKAYRREVLDRVTLYSDMHRFIPVLAAALTAARIAEIPVQHHPRRFGRSKYGWSRVWKVLPDLLTVFMIRWFRERPLLLFGSAAAIAVTLALGSGLATVLSYLRSGPSSASSLVLPGVTLLWLSLSGYLLVVGLLAETAVHGDRSP